MSATLNVGRTDRAIRLIVGLALITLAAWGLPSGLATALVWVVGAVFFATAATGFCPLYALVGIDTNGRVQRRRRAGAGK